MNQIHSTAIIEEGAVIGSNSKVWHYAHVRKGARVGENCIVSRGVYIDANVVIGSNVKIQNYVSVYAGVVIDDGVFVGPHVCFTNDLLPRAVDPTLKLKDATQWQLVPTHIHRGASIGAQSTIVAGISIGAWAMVGAGSVVTKSVPQNALVYGNPARIQGIVAPSGKIVSRSYTKGIYTDPDTQEQFKITEDA